MGNTKWTCWPFRDYETEAMEEYLEQMAEAGWHLTGFCRGGMRFEKGEPKKLRFFAAIVPGSSVFDGEDREEIASFRRRCEEAGWELVCGSYSWQVFARKEESSKPVETESLEWLKAQKATVLSPPRVVSILVMELVLLAGLWLLFKDPVRFFASKQQLFFVSVFFFCFCVIGEEAAAPFFWFRKAEKCLKEGKKVPHISFRTVWKRGIVSACCLTAVLIGFAGFGGKKELFQMLLSFAEICICWMILKMIRENDEGTRGEKVRTYVVSALLILFLLNTIVNGLLERILHGMF